MIKAAIFDLDGTLVNSMPYWKNLGKNLVISQGLEPEANLSEKVFNLSMHDGAVYLQQNYLKNWSIEKINLEIINLLSDSYKNEIQLKKGVKEFLQKLKSKNIPFALATATDRKIFAPCIERLQIKDDFKYIFTCPELNTNKDVPLIYQVACKNLGFNIEETLVFEDALIPIKSAKTAGFVTCAVSDEESLKQRNLIKKYADYFIQDFFELDFEKIFCKDK